MSIAQVVLLVHGHKPQHEWDEASHLCGVRRCVDPAHLVWESPGANLDRVLCHHYMVEVCTHKPPCVRQ